jgi:hypothetical protein
MQIWKGWAAESETVARAALTWRDWCAKLQHELVHELPPPEHQRPASSLSDRELARLAFLRWLYDTGRIVPDDCPVTRNL